MATYLLTWNPEHWTWGDFAHEARLLERGDEKTGSWTCGNSRKLKPGDRFFLLKQGGAPKGIVASGWMTSAPREGEHWKEEGRRKDLRALYVDLRFEALLDPVRRPPLGMAALARGAVGKVQWNTRTGGIRIPDEAAAALEKLWAAHLASLTVRPPIVGASVIREGEPAAPPVPDEVELLRRVTVDPKIFGGKPILRGHRLAVEHVLGMPAAGDSPQDILRGYPWLVPEDIQACLVYARRVVANERIEPLTIDRR